MTANPARKPGRIREMSEAECREMITTTTVGRIAFVDDDGQQLIPVNFAFIDEAIYFRTLSDGFLAQLARKQSEVAFGVDHHDDTYRLVGTSQSRASSSRSRIEPPSTRC